MLCVFCECDDFTSLKHGVEVIARTVEIVDVREG